VILVVAVVLAFLIGLATGGSVRALGGIHPRFFPLIFVALFIQVVIFTGIAGDTDLVHRIGPSIYVGTIALLVFVIAANLALPGLKLVLVGTLLNAAVIVANGGFMPSPEHALREAGQLEHLEPDTAGDDWVLSNSKVADDDTPLWFLGDVFYIPERWPQHNVFSIGDVLIAVGAGYAVITLMRRKPAGDVAPADTPEDEPSEPQSASPLS